MIYLFKVTKRQFRRLFKVFSLILLINYPVLPFLSSFTQGDIECDSYDILTCVSVAFLFIAIIFFFWCMVWLMVYITYFAEDYRVKKINNNLYSLPLLYVRHIQNSFRGKLIQSSSLILILCILCAGVVSLFFYEMLNLFSG